MPNLNKEMVIERVRQIVDDIGEQSQMLNWWRYEINSHLPKTRTINARQLSRIFVRMGHFKIRKVGNKKYYEINGDENMKDWKNCGHCNSFVGKGEGLYYKEKMWHHECLKTFIELDKKQKEEMVV